MPWPGQTSPTIKFAEEPRRLTPGGEGARPFGLCRGYREDGGPCNDGYATDDIFYLEICLYAQICANGKELFSLGRGQPWRCTLSRKRDLVPRSVACVSLHVHGAAATT